MNFDGGQILSTFVKMEQEVAKYYKDLAENASDERSKALLNRLSLEEENHEKIYQAILNKYGGAMEREFSNDEVVYVQSLIEQNVSAKHRFDKKMKIKDALDLAEQMERDGILFVHQMMEMYPDIAQDEMKIILKEEKKHLQLVRERGQFAPLRSLGL